MRTVFTMGSRRRRRSSFDAIASTASGKKRARSLPPGTRRPEPPGPASRGGTSPRKARSWRWAARARTTAVRGTNPKRNGSQACQEPRPAPTIASVSQREGRKGIQPE